MGDVEDGDVYPSTVIHPHVTTVELPRYSAPVDSGHIKHNYAYTTYL